MSCGDLGRMLDQEKDSGKSEQIAVLSCSFTVTKTQALTHGSYEQGNPLRYLRNFVVNLKLLK